MPEVFEFILAAISGGVVSQVAERALYARKHRVGAEAASYELYQKAINANSELWAKLDAAHTENLMLDRRVKELETELQTMRKEIEKLSATIQNLKSNGK